MSLDALISDACFQRPRLPLELRLVLLRAERGKARRRNIDKMLNLRVVDEWPSRSGSQHAFRL